MKQFLGLFACLCLAGVASGDPGGHATQALTPAIAQKILGAPVVERATPDTVTGKIWVSKTNYTLKGGSGSSPSLGLLVRHAASPAEAENIFTSSKATFKGEDVKGLGFPAYRTKMPAQLNVLKGSNWLIISAGTFKTPDTDKQVQVAKAVLPKIPND